MPADAPRGAAAPDRRGVVPGGRTCQDLVISHGAHACAGWTTLQEGIGVGQHEFGFFSRELGFEPLPRDVRRVVLEAHGVLGDWEVPIDIVPLRETRVAAKHDIDDSASLHGITIRVSGIAFTDEATVVELEAEASGVSVRAIGAEFQRQGEDRVAIVDEEGRRYMEELSRETVQRPRNDPRRTYAKLPPVRRDAPDLSVIVPAVVIADSQATLEVALPVTEPRTVMFGPYPVQLRTALVDDIPSAPGKPSDHGLRVALGAASVQEPRRVGSPSEG